MSRYIGAPHGCLMLGAASIAYLICVGPALAQSGSGAGTESVGLEEVIVTAQRRDERLMDVPVSVTALSGEALASKQILNVKDLASVAPSLTATGSFASRNDILISLRGLSLASANNNVDPTVGTYVDGVYYARTQGSNVALIDMERVEVLRGPQGTLFGRNTIGGALNISTRKPEHDFGGSFKVGFGNFGAFSATGVVNLPIVQNRLAARFVFDRQFNEGYARTINPLARKSSLDNQDQYYVRASLKANPSNDLEINLYYDRFESEADAQAWIVNYFEPSVAATASAANRPNILTIGTNYLCPGCRVSQLNHNPRNDALVHNYTGTLTWDRSFGTFKSITAYRDIDFRVGGDFDGSPLQHAHGNYTSIQDQFTQEFQLSGEAFSNRLKWIIGLYYFKEVVDENAVHTTSATLLTSNVILDAKNRSKSAFGELTYEIAQNLRLTGGLRIVRDSRSITYSQPRTTLATGAVACGLPPGLTPPPGPLCTYTPPGIKFDYMPWTLGVDYKPSDLALVYAKVSKGYRSGGYQIPGTANASGYTPFSDENVLSFEVGGKVSLLDNRVRLTGAVYDASYDQIQQNVPVIPPGSTIALTVLRNIGKARIRGAELEGTALVGKLRIDGGLGIVDPEFESGPYKGVAFVGVSKTSWSLSAEYPIDLPIGELSLHADYVWQSARYSYPPINTAVTPFQPLTAGQRASIRQGAYGLANAKATLMLDRPDITLSVWVRNLTNKFYAARSLSFYPQGYNTYNPGDPRTYGVTLGYQF